MLGALINDLAGSVYEWNPVKRKDFQPLLAAEAFFTDDRVPEAITCALEAGDFEDALRNAISLGGDADTLAAIAGPIAEARFGIPEPIARETWRRLPGEMRAAIEALYRRAGLPLPGGLAAGLPSP
jgi:ADP-ribosylglycohydrolase